MSEQPPYDGGFDLGGLPGGDPLADAMPRTDALLGEGSGLAGQPAPRPPTVDPTSVPVPRSPGAPVPGSAGSAPVPARPARGTLIAFLVVLALGVLGGAGTILAGMSGLGEPPVDPYSAPFSVGGGDLGVDATDPPASDEAPADADMVILGNGLPDAANSVRVLVLPTSDPGHFTVWHNGEVAEELDAYGGFERSYDYADTASLVVEAEGNLQCRLYVDDALVAQTGTTPTSRCRYDPVEIAAVAPGE